MFINFDICVMAFISWLILFVAFLSLAYALRALVVVWSIINQLEDLFLSRGFKSRLGMNFLNSGPANSDLSPALLLK